MVVIIEKKLNQNLGMATNEHKQRIVQVRDYNYIGSANDGKILNIVRQSIGMLFLFFYLRIINHNSYRNGITLTLNGAKTIMDASIVSTLARAKYGSRISSSTICELCFTETLYSALGAPGTLKDTINLFSINYY